MEPLALTAAASATNAAIQNKTNNINNFWQKMIDIMKIVGSLEESGLLIKGIRETIENEAKEQSGRFLGIKLSTLGTSLSGNMLSGKGILRAGEGTNRASQGF